MVAELGARAWEPRPMPRLSRGAALAAKGETSAKRAVVSQPAERRDEKGLAKEDLLGKEESATAEERAQAWAVTG